jgi:hypothetical protein
MNSVFNEAPPTKKPSMSGCEASSLAFEPVTDPPYKILVDAATAGLTLSLNHFLS